MALIRITSIEWDTDGEAVEGLPTAMVLSTASAGLIDADEDLNDWLSDKHGWCVKGSSYEEVEPEDLLDEMDERLQEMDAAGIAAVAQAVLGETYSPLGDGETIRHMGVKWKASSIAEKVMDALRSNGSEALIVSATAMVPGFLSRTGEEAPSARM